MLEMIMFAVALTVANVAGGLIMMCLMLNKKFVKKVMRASIEVSEEVVDVYLKDM